MRAGRVSRLCFRFCCRKALLSRRHLTPLSVGRGETGLLMWSLRCDPKPRRGPGPERDLSKLVSRNDRKKTPRCITIVAMTERRRGRGWGCEARGALKSSGLIAKPVRFNNGIHCYLTRQKLATARLKPLRLVFVSHCWKFTDHEFCSLRTLNSLCKNYC